MRTGLFFLLLFFAGISVVLFFPRDDFSGIQDESSFDPDGCIHGESGSWTGGCGCYQRFDVSGKYCDSPAQGECFGNRDCHVGFYCNQDKVNDKGDVQGRCFEKDFYAFFENDGKRFILGRSLMNFESVRFFCTSFGKGWRPAVRYDLGCAGNGLGCVAGEILRLFQKKQGIRGFVWLDEAEGRSAFYMDINDGNVYYMPRDISSVAQGLCVREKR